MTLKVTMNKPRIIKYLTPRTIGSGSSLVARYVHKNKILLVIKKKHSLRAKDAMKTFFSILHPFEETE